MTPPRVAVGPQHASFATDAVAAGGGTLVDIGERPDALVWLDPADVQGLADQLASAPDVRWVQLPFAGVERVAEPSGCSTTTGSGRAPRAPTPSRWPSTP